MLRLLPRLKPLLLKLKQIELHLKLLLKQPQKKRLAWLLRPNKPVLLPKLLPQLKLPA